MIVDFIDTHRQKWGIGPICTVLKDDLDLRIAPSTYHAHKTRQPSAREIRDGEMKEKIMTIHAHKRMKVYGIRKIHAQLNRTGTQVARCTIERLCRDLGIRGTVRGRFPRTTRPAPETRLPGDLVNREFTAARPNELWVADFTYVKTLTGWVYVSFILDVFSRRIVGWKASERMYTSLALDALHQALFARRGAGQDITGLVHHSDRGVQYRALRYTQELEAADAVASVGSRGDSYDNAMAEALNSLYKHEFVFADGPWVGLDDLEAGTAEWVHWYNTERLHGELDYRTPVEVEDAYWAECTAAEGVDSAA